MMTILMFDVIVMVSSDLTVVEGHNITKEIETKLKREFNISEAIVHVELDI